MRSLVSKSENSLVNELNRVFNRFSRDLDFPDFGSEELVPKVEIKEKNNCYIIRAEVPGMSEEDLDVSLKDNCLIIKGEKKSDKESEEEGQYFSEFSYGSFFRSVPLKEEVNPESVKASSKDGVLSVEIEKVAEGTENKARKIPILKQ